jgi:TolC family type I secretion outer membrane protein
MFHKKIIIIIFTSVFFLHPFAKAEIQTDAPAERMTMQEALRHVYKNNPELQAARAELRATHEMYPQALAGWRPVLAAETSLYSTNIDNSNFGGADGTTTKDVRLSIDQPLYRGGSTQADSARAKSLIKAGYGDMLQTEEDVFLRAATAYMNVIRDRELLELSRNNELLLGKELDAAKERFKGGDLTKTDINQAETRLAKARAGAVSAMGALENSGAAFQQVMGFSPPAELYFPDVQFVFPPDAESMIHEAENANPVLGSSKNMHEAAEHLVRSTTGELLPQFSAFASYNKQIDPQPGIMDDSEEKMIGIRARLSLYQAGLIHSRVREAKNTAMQRLQEIEKTRRSVRQDIISRWRSLESARGEILMYESQAEAAKMALEGVREEARMGERTVLDILDADQELLEAQASLARARRDEIVYSFALAASLGYLLPEKIGMADLAYDPGPHYRNIGEKIVNMDAE